MPIVRIGRKRISYWLPPPFLKIVEPDEKKDLERDGNR